FCVPSVTRWSLLPALYGTGFSSEQSAREMPDNITLTN
ncbi:GTP-binding protein, partial [Escherichia coli]